MKRQHGYAIYAFDSTYDDELLVMVMLGTHEQAVDECKKLDEYNSAYGDGSLSHYASPYTIKIIDRR
jgi:hypothetical protein